MSIDEQQLRSQLGPALDRFVPGPVPIPALIRQGKAMVIRRRIVTIGAVALAIAAAAVIAPLGLRNSAAHRPPVSPTHYTVTEHSAQLAHPLPISYNNNITDSAKVAYGRVNNRSWWVTLSVHAGVVSVISRDLVVTVNVGSGYAPLNPRSGPFASLISNGGSPQIDYGIVRADVSYLRVHLTNGQTLSVRPVAVFSPRYARYVAFAVPYNSAVTEVAAYSAHSELGYAIPFTRYGQLWIRWIPAGRPTLPAPTSYLIGSGTVGRQRWSVRLDVGPWGTCQVMYATNPGYPLAWCPTPELKGDQVAQVLAGSEGWLTPKHLPAKGSVTVGVIDVIQTTPTVSYLILTRHDGSTLRVATVGVGRWRYASFPTSANFPQEPSQRTPALAVVRWTAYNSSGRRLGSGSALR